MIKLKAEQGMGGIIKKQIWLRAMKSRKLWGAMITYILEGHGT